MFLGVALAGVILTSIRGVRQDMARLESRLDGKFDALSAQLGELSERMAHLRPRVLDFMQLAQTVFSKIVHDQLVASPGRVRAELPVELRPGR